MDTDNVEMAMLEHSLVTAEHALSDAERLLNTFSGTDDSLASSVRAAVKSQRSILSALEHVQTICLGLIGNG